MIFFDQPDILPGFVAVNRPRAIAAGIDQHQYDEVTAALTAMRHWPDAFVATGLDHLGLAERAEEEGRVVSAGEAYRDAALWLHFATVLPNPDLQAHQHAAAASADALRRALRCLDPTAEHLTDTDFVGILRRPNAVERPPVVVIVPGMNSGKVEFMPIAESLLRRGVAVLSVDGPGQGELATTSHWQPEYQKVLHRVIDELEGRPDLAGDRVGMMALSMGGYLGAVAAAHEPRLRALVTVSGPSALSWDELPPYVTESFILRTGSERAARDFADGLDVSVFAERIRQPLRVVEGGLDVIPGVTNGESLARLAPSGEYLVLPGGNHLVENMRWKWLPQTTDWLVGHLT